MYLTPNADPSSSACYFAETGPNDKVFSTCKRSLLNMPLALYVCCNGFHHLNQLMVIAFCKNINCIFTWWLL